MGRRILSAMTYDRDDVACHHCFEQKALKDWIKSEGTEHLSLVRAPRRAPAAGKAAFASRFVEAFLWRKIIEGNSDGVPEFIDGSACHFAQ